MTGHPLSLFALQGSQNLAEKVAARLDAALAAVEERNFEDGEHKTRPLQEVRGHDVYVLHGLYGDGGQTANDKLCRLLFFCGALRDAGTARITAVVPYLCYARKDRRTKPNDPVTTRYVAAMFEAVGVDGVIALEVHNPAAFENAFRIPSWHIEWAPLLAAHFTALARGGPMVAVSPDAGGSKRAEQFRLALQEQSGCEVGSAIMEKSRSGGVVSGALLAGDLRGKAAVIVDDLISTGGTLVRAANACRAAGATQVFAAAAHGLFIDGAPELLAAKTIDGIAIANSVPPFRLTEQQARRLTILDVSAPIAEAIAACHGAGP
jgi:ribose-phosphate pyrophosphokinase